MATTPIPDNFGDGSLGAHWTIVDPRGDGTWAETGGYLKLAVPNTDDHANGGVTTGYLRARQACPNEDLDLRVRITTPYPDSAYQVTGLLIGNSGHTDWLDFAHYTWSGGNKGFECWQGPDEIQKLVAYGPPQFSTDYYLRITRVTNTWRFYYGTNGTDWTEVQSGFSYTMTVATVAIYCGNAWGLWPEGSRPANEVHFTDFYNPNYATPVNVTLSPVVLTSPHPPLSINVQGRRARLAFAELETPEEARRGRISFAEMETDPNARQGRISFAAMETPSISTADLSPPPYIVRIAFPDNPLAASPTWSTVTADVRSIKIDRGRGNEFTEFETGTATLVLGNASGNYDPDNASGTHYPNVLPYRRISIQADLTARGGGVESLFDGYIANWTQSGNVDRITTLEAVDLMGLLAHYPTNYSYATAALALKPIAHWDFANGVASTSLGTALDDVLEDVSGNRHAGLYKIGDAALAGGSVGITPTGQTTWAIGDGERAAHFNGLTSYVKIPSDVALLCLRSQTIAFWIKLDSHPLSAVAYVISNDSGVVGSTERFWDVTVYADGDVSYGKRYGENVTVEFTYEYATIAYSAVLDDDAWHHIVGVYDADIGLLSLYADGELLRSMAVPYKGLERAATPQFLGGPYISPDQAVIIGGQFAQPNTLNYRFPGQLAHVSVYERALDEAHIRSLYRSRLSAIASGLLHTRLSLLFENWVGLPAAYVVLDGTLSELTVSGVTVDNQSAIELAREWCSSVGAFLWVSRDGKLRVEDKNNRVRAEWGVALGDAAGDFGVLDLQTAYDESLIINLAKVQQIDGSIVIAEDATSQAKFGVRPIAKMSHSLYEQRGQAEWLVHSYASPATRIVSVSFTGGSDADAYEVQAQADIGQRMQIHDDTRTYEVFVEAVSHDITPATWVSTLSLSPASLWTAWVLGRDALDTTARLYW